MYGHLHCHTQTRRHTSMCVRAECVNIRHRMQGLRKPVATQGLKHASNLTKAISLDKFQPIGHFLRMVLYVAFFALYALRCGLKLHLIPGVNGGYVEWANLLSADQTMLCWKVRRRPVAANWRYIQAFQMTVPEIIIASHCCRTHGTCTLHL